jgi:hypothetical protein
LLDPSLERASLGAKGVALFAVLVPVMVPVQLLARQARLDLHATE